MEPIRVLCVNGGLLNRGGIEAVIMNYYRNIDKSKVQFDFVVHGFEKGIHDEEIELLGGKIYNIPIKSKDYVGNIKALRAIFDSGVYKIVHSHMDAMGMLVLKTAMKCGIPFRIAHSHNTNHLTNNKIKYYLNEYARKNIKKYATHLLSCSEMAGRWLFGDDAFNGNNVRILNNAIDSKNFYFNEFTRIKVRKHLDLQDNLVFGHVGRFEHQKNHLFLIDIFHEILKLRKNAKLILIGDGHLKNQIMERTNQIGISEKVLLLGLRTDINELLNAFDALLLPSLFEGLPVVLIEAQANGLQSFVSDSITREVNILNLVKYFSLNDSAPEWAAKILSNYSYGIERKVSKNSFIATGYDIENSALDLQNLYLNLLID